MWEYPLKNASTGVKGLLEAAGHRVFNPTLPHHDRGESTHFHEKCRTVKNRQVSQHLPFYAGTWEYTADMTANALDYVNAIADVILSNNLTNVVLVAHSLSGVWTQLAAQQVGVPCS